MVLVETLSNRIYQGELEEAYRRGFRDGFSHGVNITMHPSECPMWQGDSRTVPLQFRANFEEYRGTISHVAPLGVVALGVMAHWE